MWMLCFEKANDVTMLRNEQLRDKCQPDTFVVLILTISSTMISKRKPLMVGVEMMEVNSSEGTANGAKKLKDLLQNKDWVEAISASDELNVYSGLEENYPPSKHGCISPMAYVTTNVCGCCS